MFLWNDNLYAYKYGHFDLPYFMVLKCTDFKFDLEFINKKGMR